MGWWASEQNWGDCQDYLSGANKMELKCGSGKKCWTPALPLHAAPSVVSCNPIIHCLTKGPLEEVNTEEYKICYWPWTHLRHNDETLFICRLPFTRTIKLNGLHNIWFLYHLAFVLVLSSKARLCGKRFIYIGIISDRRPKTLMEFSPKWCWKYEV